MEGTKEERERGGSGCRSSRGRLGYSKASKRSRRWAPLVQKSRRVGTVSRFCTRSRRRCQPAGALFQDRTESGTTIALISTRMPCRRPARSSGPSASPLCYTFYQQPDRLCPRVRDLLSSLSLSLSISYSPFPSAIIIVFEPAFNRRRFRAPRGCTPRPRSQFSSFLSKTSRLANNLFTNAAYTRTAVPYDRRQTFTTRKLFCSFR